jgi:hypothetical protein
VRIVEEGGVRQALSGVRGFWWGLRGHAREDPAQISSKKFAKIFEDF